MPRPWRWFRFFERSLGAAPALPVPPGLLLRQITEPEAGRWCAAELDLREAGMAAAFGRGDLFVGAFAGDELVGYCWLAFAPLPHLDGVWVRFAPAAVWTYKSFVRATHRGRGIAPALYRALDGACLERGRNRSLLCVEWSNAPSVAAALRAGYFPAGYAAYLRHPSAVLAWRSPAARRQAIEFFRPGAPNFRAPRSV